MTTTEPLSSLIKQRSSAKGNINRIRRMYQDNTASLNPIDVECRLEILNSYIKQLMAYQTEIEKLCPEDNKRGELEDICVGAKSLLLSVGGVRRTSASHDTTMNASLPPASRLPSLKIPKFNGMYSEYKNFITCFNNLVNNDPNLSTIEKFNHLINSLQDDALRTVKAFQVNDQNYSCALQRLADRYDNKCLIFQDHISSLFNLRKITRPNSSELRQIVDTVSAVLDSLSHLGTEKDITHAIIIHLVLSKVDSESKSKWDEQLNYTSLPQWSDCASVLIRRCQFLEMNDDKDTKTERVFNKQFKSISNNKEGKKTQFSFSCTQSHLVECLFCSSKEHTIVSCSMFAKLNVTQRFEFTKKKGLCINCLKYGHTVKKCRSSRCNLCQRPHHTLLHNEKLLKRNEIASIHNSDHSPSQWTNHEGAAVVMNSAQGFAPHAIENGNTGKSFEYPQIARGLVSQGSNTQRSEANNQSVTSMVVRKIDQQVILATAMVQVRDKSGKYMLARALLDSGSQINLMSEELAQRLSIKRCEGDLKIVGIGKAIKNVRQSLSTYVKTCINEFEFVADFFILKSISGKLPNERIDKIKLGIPKNIILADSHFDRPQRIDVLLGAESFYELLSVGQIKLGPTLPILQKTLLGWIVSGKYEAKGEYSSQVHQLIANSENLSSLNDIVERFWELEQVPKCAKLTDEHVDCQINFDNNTRRVCDGRFEVRLPFKTDPRVLGKSYEIALKRFLSLERRVQKDSELRNMYIMFMKEYLNLGHMSPTDNVVPSSPHYFIPHQCVIRAQSTTTRLRVVFDASSKTSTQKSLNDTLMVGPTIQDDLFSILLRFRLNKFAITADITKMYRQVRVHKDDRKFQLILWRENPYIPIQIYELNTVTYGTAPAPYLAIRCLKEMSDNFKQVYPIGSHTVATDFYVDDLLTGADDIETLEQIRTEVAHILSSCGFNLAKWYSNCRDFKANELVRHLELNSSDFTRALGIIWKPEEDILGFHLENNFDKLRATKRNILSISSRLFDPLGLLAPIVIKATILLQEIWEANLDWDESIPQNLDTSWTNFKKILLQIDSISIPRFVGTTLKGSIQVHGFSDASMSAYGCCIYIRSMSTNSTDTRLLVAKSKVAPSRKVKTLPRLELCAAHLLSKLWTAVREKLSKFNVHTVTFWSDSEIILHWLNTHPSALHTFVSNRVADIQENSSGATWRYVPTKYNPADIVSRGCDINELKTSMWFGGPEFLRESEENWPRNKQFELSPDSLRLEKKKTCETKVLLLHSENIDSVNRVLQVVEAISSSRRVIRIVAYILRFIGTVKKKLRTMGALGSEIMPLNVSELDFSFNKIIQIIQNVEFDKEISILRESVLPKQNRIQKLCPFIQNYSVDGIGITLLRVGGRLSKSLFPYEVKYLLLVKRDSHFIKMYFADLHRSNNHVGPKSLLSLSREKIWIINGRQLTRKTVNDCVFCFRFRPKLASQIMSDLPRDRITGCRPFYVCGVDLCGPVYTSLRIRGRPPVKTYIAVFVCFASKAVHLEALCDLQTDSFISTLNRFVGRRGLPKIIWSDNATNFVGTARLWSGNRKMDVQQKMAERGIDFRFIPPRAPHFGGLWEAAVKSAKTLLLKTISTTKLSYEELTTLLVDVEAVLNSRPIVALTEDPNDEEALTPGHLLIGCSLKALPKINEQSNKAGSLKRFRLLSSLKEHFWDVWQRDYIRDLQQRTRWTTTSVNLKIGDVVIVHEDNLPPQKWIIGKVESVEIGNDGKVRVAVVKTKHGLYKRAIHKLAPLPFNNLQPE